jgi:HD superfamily phosphohydrolase YqeK
MDNQTAINRISEYLKPERVKHSIVVAEICKTLARFHKIDAQKA